MVVDNRDKIGLLFSITLLGAALRFKDLGVNPLWIDEAIFAVWSSELKLIQEYPTILIAHLFGFTSEFWLRFTSALAGTLTIPAVYFVVKKHKLAAATVVAVFPLFVFWSRMARPYAFAGLFMVLGWRWWYFSIVSVMTNVISAVGIKIFRQKKYILLLLVPFVIFSFINKENTNLSLYAITNYSRLFYLPLLALLLYAFSYDFGFKHYTISALVLIIFSAVFFPSDKYGEWYSKDVSYSDWRGTPKFDFTSNQFASNWYSGGRSLQINEKFFPLLLKVLDERGSVRIGMDYRIFNPGSVDLIPRNIVDKYKQRLLAGEVVGIEITKQGYKEVN